MDQWLVSELVWVRVGVALLFLSTALVLIGPLLRWPADRIVIALLCIAVAAIGLGIALRWHLHGQGPFLTLYEILVSNVFSLGVFFLLSVLIVPAVRPASPVALLVLSLLGLWAISASTELIPLPPTFDNPWLWAHVLAGKLFLGACLVAMSLSVRLLLGRGASRERVQRHVEMLDAQVWRFAALAFLFDSVMLVAGAAWAHDAWGRYWSWDPLETWALLTWLALAVVLHARLSLRLPRWSGWVGICVVFTLAFLTFFGVPFLSHAPHKGVM